MRLAPIGEHVRAVRTWNPKAGGNGGTFTYIDIGAVSQDEKVIEPGKPIACAEAPSRARQLVAADDVLVSTVRPNLNAVARVPDDLHGATASTGFCVLRPDPRSLAPAFLFHWVRSPDFVSEMVKLATGQSYPAVSDRIVKESLIPLPPLEEQRRIAAILDQADALRRLRARALTRLDALGQAIFQEMFGDVVTNPLGWEEARLGELCEVGSSKRVFVEEFTGSGIPFFRGTEVGKLGAGEEISPNLFISPDHYSELIQQSGKPEIGDLLLPSICQDGRIWHVQHEDPFYFKDGRVLWVKAGQSAINSEYLRSFLRSKFLKSYASIASGTTFAELKIVNLKNLKVLQPPRSLQEEFASRVQAVDASRHALVQSVAASETLFASLQHRAFRGAL